MNKRYQVISKKHGIHDEYSFLGIAQSVAVKLNANLLGELANIEEELVEKLKKELKDRYLEERFFVEEK